MHPGDPAAGRPNPVRRPSPVTVAAAVMIGMGLVGLLHALVGLAMMNRAVRHVRSVGREIAAPPSEVDAVVLLARAGAVVAAVVGVFFALLLVALALGNLRGRNPARVGTWVVCGLGLLCGCAGVIATVTQRSLPLKLPDDQVRAELLHALGDAYPSWWIWLTGGLSAAQTLGYLVVALLLALPAATAFFRREPSVGGPPPAPPAPTTPPM
ncbi:hypothetical protein [Micromonospora sp. NPDC049679]|uniref:hypothetical protein n=1 Tax=Micromonospora sp. NPDC049679 TaxID=3155920 RepID=UPI0033E643CF